jgi:hypothetical protein
MGLQVVQVCAMTGVSRAAAPTRSDTYFILTECRCKQLLKSDLRARRVGEDAAIIEGE